MEISRSKTTAETKGFTILELLVVIAIIGIISAVSFAMLSKSRNDADAKAGCSELAALINKARSYALSGKADSSGDRLPSVMIRVNGDQIEICGNSNGDSDCSDSGDQRIETYTLRRGVSCGSGYITYGVPDGGSSVSSATFNCVSSGRTHSVSVDRYKAVCN